MKKIILLVLLVSQISCVQEMRDIKVHFAVDMSAIENIESVGIIGEYEPMSWDEPIALTDEDDDNIYEGTIIIKAAYNYAEFKFVLNDKTIELEGQRNREVYFRDVKEVEYRGVFDEK